VSRALKWFSFALSAISLVVLASSLLGLQPNPRFVAAQAAIPLTLTLSALAAVSSMAASTRLPKVLAFAALGLWVALLLDVNLAARPESVAGPGLKVVAANMLLTNQETSQAVADILAQRPEVLLTVETTEATPPLLEAAGFNLVASGLERATHVKIWSRLPAHPLPRIDLGDRSLPVASVSVRGTEVVVVGVHLMSPTTERTFATWRSNWDRLAPALRDLNGPTMVLGDFNTSTLHPQMRGLLGRYDSASASSWRTYVSPTWPALPYRWWSQPLKVLDLDHILVQGLAAAEFTRFEVSGSDHLAVAARIEPMYGTVD
jgi:endonuclease/exonuclease/phosphatase (EEP) superfamily protein YafD